MRWSIQKRISRASQPVLAEMASQHGRPGRAAHRNGCLPEPVVRPALRLQVLAPGHHRDAIGPQLEEQARARGVAGEEQGQVRLRMHLAALGQQVRLLPLRHDAAPDLAHHAVVHLALQAQQRLPAQRVPSSRPQSAVPAPRSMPATRRKPPAGATGTCAQAWRRECQGLAIRQAVRGSAGGEADRPCVLPFPLRIPLGREVGHPMRGVNFIPWCIKSHKLSNRACRCPRHSGTGTRFPSNSLMLLGNASCS